MCEVKAHKQEKKNLRRKKKSHQFKTFAANVTFSLPSVSFELLCSALQGADPISFDMFLQPQDELETPLTFHLAPT